MIETMILISFLNLGFTGWTYYKHKQLETIVLYGNFPSDFPGDPRVPSPDTSPVSLKPRPGGVEKRAPIARTDADLFELEKNKE
jgi:hypothetical protein